MREIRAVKLSTDASLNPDWLIKGIKSFFSDDIWNAMSDLEKIDLEDGCCCITLETWNPAAMIIMISVEATLRSYYQDITGNNSSGKNIDHLSEN